VSGALPLQCESISSAERNFAHALQNDNHHESCPKGVDEMMLGKATAGCKHSHMESTRSLHGQQTLVNTVAAHSNERVLKKHANVQGV